MEKELMDGLTSKEVERQQAIFGKNELSAQRKESFFIKIIHIISEPMFLLLIVAATIYFILGEPRDGAIMLVFVVGIISIEIIQEWKTDKTLNALKELSAPHVEVIRDGIRQTIASTELVPNDVMLISEGVKIPADGKVIKANDLCVDESSLTGESQGVWKVVETVESDDYWRKDYCYAGTLVTQGSATILVDKTGSQTEYGKIGSHMVDIKEGPTPLSIQTGKIVKTASIIALFCFLLAIVITFINLKDYALADRAVKSILAGITLAMALIPEEFPVILAVFLSMGAWRLAKKQALVRKLPAVETLGAVSVLCVDKTGTITLNKMSVVETWAKDDNLDDLVEVMGLACETEAYDPMEQAMLAYCENYGVTKAHLFSGHLINEYAFTNELKMMGHIWHHDDEIIVAAKGSCEMILQLCHLSKKEQTDVDLQIKAFSEQGLRVIAVAKMMLKSEADIPKTILECSLELCGLIGLADPPRPTIKHDIQECTKAGIRVVMITGDNGLTAQAIANQIMMPNADKIITGNELMEMSDEQLRLAVKDVSIFSRVLPEHKMRIVKAFKDNGQIVAMTGDGVNDAPALKYADIGIAMGKHGSDVSREAADLILLDDNFSTIVETVKDGRRIYDNIRKAVGYVFTIHIPIAFAALVAPLLGIAPASLLLLPLHVVLLELIIDPTCSIVLERQPAEDDIMERKPRNINEKMLNKATLIKSFAQGIVIFIASFFTYYFMLENGYEAAIARTMGISIIMISNLFLVFVNSSDHDSMLKSTHRLIKDKVMWLVVIFTVAMLGIIVYTPLNSGLRLAPLSLIEMMSVVLISMIAVLWFEVIKFYKRKKLANV